jgi:deoxyribodipyrimidine photolyase
MIVELVPAPPCRHKGGTRTKYVNNTLYSGVGADPRGKRQFDLDKQTRQYDPEGRFINKWQGQIQNLPLDSVHAADSRVLFFMPHQNR